MGGQRPTGATSCEKINKMRRGCAEGRGPFAIIGHGGDWRATTDYF